MRKLRKLRFLRKGNHLRTVRTVRKLRKGNDFRTVRKLRKLRFLRKRVWRLPPLERPQGYCSLFFFSLSQKFFVLSSRKRVYICGARIKEPSNGYVFVLFHSLACHSLIFVPSDRPVAYLLHTCCRLNAEFAKNPPPCFVLKKVDSFTDVVS